ncbi:MAG TPA: TMEM165/GDT1 family protein [Firmicutes bacterium]|nr:TMEM165/GDT1 family protein [Bacillota bacterium]
MSLITCFVTIFLAELGDKTQILSVIVAARYGSGKMLLGALIGAAAVSLVSVLLGVGFSTFLPAKLFQVCSGLLFFSLGVKWLLHTAEPKGSSSYSGDGTVLGIAMGFFLAELGDKTMLASASMAGRFAPHVVWLGTVAGLMASEMLAAGLSRMLGEVTGPIIIKCLGATLFIVLGLFAVVTAFVTYPYVWPH